jgi:hypothetical protein
MNLSLPSRREIIASEIVSLLLSIKAGPTYLIRVSRVSIAQAETSAEVYSVIKKTNLGISYWKK